VSAHVLLEALEDLDAPNLDPDVRCRCLHCGAVALRETVAKLTLADFLDTAIPFLARHALCADRSGGES
jgi:hypothetical protein